MNAVLTALLLSLVAGMGTGLGGLLAVVRKPGRRQFGFLMGMTAGVMISLSFLELVNEAWQQAGYITATIGFGSGAICMFLIDILIPHVRFSEAETPAPDQISQQVVIASAHPGRHQYHGRRRHHAPVLDPRLLKSGILIAIGITIHNFPEGVAVGAGYMQSPQFGLFIAIAIMLHNIPEGIATALAVVPERNEPVGFLPGGILLRAGGAAWGAGCGLVPGFFSRPHSRGAGLCRGCDGIHHPR